MDNMNEKLRRDCDSAGFTRADIAAHIGVSKHTVDNWFSSGRPIPPAKLRAIKELLSGGQRTAVKYDDIMSFSVRLTPAEYRQLCSVVGAQEMSPAELERAVRDLLQKTWDELAKIAPNVVESDLQAAENEWNEMVMPAPSVFPMPFPLSPAAKSGRSSENPTC